MRKNLFVLLVLLTSTVAHAQYKSQAWCPDNGDGTYTNPVLYADYSDPDVCAVGEDYSKIRVKKEIHFGKKSYLCTVEFNKAQEDIRRDIRKESRRFRFRCESSGNDGNGTEALKYANWGG